MQRIFPLTVAVILALMPAAAMADFSPSALGQAFYRTMFGLEYAAHNGDATRVKRYTNTVRFYVDDRSGLNRGPAAKKFVASLPRTIRNFKGTLVNRPSAANFKVVLVRSRDFADVVAGELNADAIAMNAKCLVGVQTQGGRIVRSTAIIVADRDFLFRRCLVEEVLQGLGPMNDDDRLRHSVFNDSSRHARFTEFDQALMNIIYHPAIRPGMSREAAGRVLPRVLRDLGYDR